MSVLSSRLTIRASIAISRVAGVMSFVAATMAVASSLHLSGTAKGRSAPFDAVHAGFAEAAFGTVLVAAAVGIPAIDDRR